MKKFLSLLICFTMVLAVLMNTAAAISDGFTFEIPKKYGNGIELPDVAVNDIPEPEEPIAVSDVTSVNIDPISITEGMYYHVDRHYDEASGVTYEYSKYFYDDCKTRINIYFGDGSVVFLTRINERFEYKDEVVGITWEDDQYKTPWEAGSHTAHCTVLGYRFDVTVTIIENPVDHVEAAPISFIEGAFNSYRFYDDGDDDPTNDPEYDFYAYIDNNDVTVYFKDGTSVKADHNSVFYCGEEYFIEQTDDQSPYNVWTAGVYEGHGKVLGFDFTVNVTIIGNPIDHIDAPDIYAYAEEIIEHYVYEDENGEPVPAYYYNYVSKCNFTVYFKDGTSAEMVNGRSVEYNGMELRFERRDDQSAENVWKIGSNKAKGSIAGYEFEFNVVLCEAPVSFDIKDTVIPRIIFDNFRDFISYAEKRIQVEVTDNSGAVYTGNLFDGVDVNGYLFTLDTEYLLYRNDPGVYEFNVTFGDLSDSFTLTVTDDPFDAVYPVIPVQVPDNAEKTVVNEGEEDEYYAYDWQKNVKDIKVVVKSDGLIEDILSSAEYTENGEYTEEEYIRAWESLDEAGEEFALDIIDFKFFRYGDKYCEQLLGVSFEDAIENEDLIDLFSSVYSGYVFIDDEGRYTGAYSGRIYEPGQFTAADLWEEMKLAYTDEQTGKVDYISLSENEQVRDPYFRCVSHRSGVERFIIAENGVFTFEGDTYTVGFADEQKEQAWTTGYNPAYLLVYNEDGDLIRSSYIEVELCSSFDFDKFEIKPVTVYESDAETVQIDGETVKWYRTDPYDLDMTVTVDGTEKQARITGIYSLETPGDLFAEFEYEGEIYNIYISGWQDLDTAWSLGENTVEYEVFGKKMSFTVTVVDNSVKSVYVADLAVFEEKDGFVSALYDENNNVYTRGEILNEDFEVTVTLNDGTVINGINGVDYLNEHYELNITGISDMLNDYCLGSGVHTVSFEIAGYESEFLLEVIESYYDTHAIMIADNDDTYSEMFLLDDDKYEPGTTVYFNKDLDDGIYAAISGSLNGSDQFSVIQIYAENNGEPVQSDGAVRVLADLSSLPADVDINTLRFISSDENGNLSDIEYTVDNENRSITFELNGDTYYVMTLKEEEPPLLGDVNGDGRVNNKDVVVLFRYVSGIPTVPVNEAVADVNNDGKINNKDVVTLFRMILRSED